MRKPEGVLSCYFIITVKSPVSGQPQTRKSGCLREVSAYGTCWRCSVCIRLGFWPCVCLKECLPTGGVHYRRFDCTWKATISWGGAWNKPGPKWHSLWYQILLWFQRQEQGNLEWRHLELFSTYPFSCTKAWAHHEKTSPNLESFKTCLVTKHLKFGNLLRKIPKFLC